MPETSPLLNIDNLFSTFSFPSFSLEKLARQFVAENHLSPIKKLLGGEKGKTLILQDNSYANLQLETEGTELGQPQPNFGGTGASEYTIWTYILQGEIAGEQIELGARLERRIPYSQVSRPDTLNSNRRIKTIEPSTPEIIQERTDNNPYWFVIPQSTPSK